MTTNSHIMLTGDTHGAIDIKKIELLKLQDALTKDDYLIICGDFGAVWFGDERDNRLLDYYNGCPWTTLFVDGNHENFDALEKYPMEKWHGGKIHRISSSIIHLMRGEIYDICGKSFFVMGGAMSHDKEIRSEGVDWWPQEMPSVQEMQYAFDNLEAHNNRADYILTHDAPASVVQLMFRYISPTSDSLRRMLDLVAKTVEFKDWYFGHYHFNYDNGKFHCLYDTFIEIK